MENQTPKIENPKIKTKPSKRFQKTTKMKKRNREIPNTKTIKKKTSAEPRKYKTSKAKRSKNNSKIQKCKKSKKRKSKTN